MKWYDYIGLFLISGFSGAIIMLASERLFGNDGWEVWVGAFVGICIYVALLAWHDYCYKNKWFKK